jgi:predicted PurR-regulated permease PerM
MDANPRTSRSVLVVLIVLALVLLAAILRPLGTALFTAGVLAGAFSPLYERLVGKLHGRRTLAAALVTLLVILSVGVPLGTLGAVAVKETLQGVSYVRGALKSGGASGLINRLPERLRDRANKWVSSLSESGDEWLSRLTSASEGAAAALGGVLSATSKAVVQTIFALIALFFLLTDGHRLVRWLNDIMPLGHGQFLQLLSDFRRVSVAVLSSTVATAGVQSFAALIGYLIARVPNALFFSLVTFFAAFIPAVGATSVPVILSIVLFFAGRGAGWSLFLLVWGLVAVGLIDNVVKPLFIRGGVQLHGAVVFFSLIGGLAAFGLIGLIAGPLIVAFFLAVVRMSQRDLAEPTSPPTPPAATS